MEENQTCRDTLGDLGMAQQIMPSECYPDAAVYEEDHPNQRSWGDHFLISQDLKSHIAESDKEKVSSIHAYARSRHHSADYCGIDNSINDTDSKKNNRNGSRTTKNRSFSMGYFELRPKLSFRGNMCQFYQRNSQNVSLIHTVDNSLRFSNCGKFKDRYYQSTRCSQISNFFHRRSSAKLLSNSFFTDGDVKCSGYLKKLGAWRKNWKKRYFILRFDKPVLSYYDTEDDLRTLGEINIRMEDRVVDRSADGQAPFIFEYRSVSRLLVLEAESRIDQLRWMQVLEDVIASLGDEDKNEGQEIQEAPIDFSFLIEPEAEESAFEDSFYYARRSSDDTLSGDRDNFWMETPDDKTVYVSLELEIETHDKRYIDAPFFIIAEVEQKDSYSEIARTEFQCLDEKLRRRFFIVLTLHAESQDARLRFSIVQLANETKGFRSPALCAGFVSCQVGSIIDREGQDEPLVVRADLMKSSRFPYSKRLGRQVLGKCKLLLSVLSPDSFSNEANVSGLVGAKSLYIAERATVLSIPGEKPEIGDVTLTEKLVVPDATFDVPIAYLQFLIKDKAQKIARLRQLMTSPSLSTEIDSASVLNQIQAYEEIIKEYEVCVKYYRKRRLMHGQNLGDPIFKKSNMKSDKKWRFIATNLQNEIIQAHLSSAHIYVWNTITFGCAAAHAVGFKCGGARKQLESLQKPSSIRRKNDVQYSNMVIKFEKRFDMISSQILSAAITAIYTTIELAAQGSTDHRRTVLSMASVGYLLSIESLLSTQGKELGMLEDTSVAVNFLNAVSIRFCVEGSQAATKGKIYIRRHTKQIRDSLLVTLRLAKREFFCLTRDLREGKVVKLYAVLFTQGINEMQTIANVVRRCSLQEVVNRESLTILKTFYYLYRKTLYGTEWESEILGIDDMLNTVDNLVANSKFEKNVNMLVLTSDLCRALGGGRLSCCKSGKDRTAMSITLEQARIVSHLGVLRGRELCTSMRLCGVRRQNVYMNTKKNEFAFNLLQHKLLPDCYKPPPGTYSFGKA